MSAKEPKYDASEGVIKTKFFDFYSGKTADLARITGLDISTISYIRRGYRAPGTRFIATVLSAFPHLKFDDVFYIDDEVFQRLKEKHTKSSLSENKN